MHVWTALELEWTQSECLNKIWKSSVIRFRMIVQIEFLWSTENENMEKVLVQINYSSYHGTNLNFYVYTCDWIQLTPLDIMYILPLYQHACWRQRVCHVFYCVNHVTTAKANHVIEQSQSPISLIKSVRFYSWCLCMLWQAIWWIKSDTWWFSIKSALI